MDPAVQSESFEDALVNLATALGRKVTVKLTDAA